MLSVRILFAHRVHDVIATATGANDTCNDTDSPFSGSRCDGVGGEVSLLGTITPGMSQNVTFWCVSMDGRTACNRCAHNFADNLVLYPERW